MTSPFTSIQGIPFPRPSLPYPIPTPPIQFLTYLPVFVSLDKSTTLLSSLLPPTQIPGANFLALARDGSTIHEFSWGVREKDAPEVVGMTGDTVGPFPSLPFLPFLPPHTLVCP